MTVARLDTVSRAKDSPLRIGYLIQQFPPEVGAGAARASELATRWARAGATVTVITGMPNRPSGRIYSEYRGRLFTTEDWQGVRVLRSWLYASPRDGILNTMANNATFSATAFVRALLNGRPLDVLIASSPPFLPHLSGALAARAMRVPLVLEIRDLWPDYLVDMGMLGADTTPARLLFRLERALLKRAHAVSVVTESFRRRVIAKGVPESVVRILPNGVDLNFYRQRDHASSEHSQGRRRAEEFVIGYLGNFGAGQDLSVILSAIKQVASTGIRLRLIMTGDGPQRDRLIKQAGDLRLDDIVTITGPIAKERTVDFYSECDACIVPLANVPVFQETVPSKIFEIMACERPIIGCFGGEAARILSKSAGGIVAAPGDVSSIARAIATMVEIPSTERAVMGASARRFVKEHYDRDTIAARYLSFLNEVSAAYTARATSVSE